MQIAVEEETVAVLTALSCLVGTPYRHPFQPSPFRSSPVPGQVSQSLRSAMLQELSHMDRITQLQDEIQQVRFDDFRCAP